jgi:hypothetical protein
MRMKVRAVRRGRVTIKADRVPLPTEAKYVVRAVIDPPIMKYIISRSWELAIFARCRELMSEPDVRRDGTRCERE